jgi:hypothetical protein
MPINEKTAGPDCMAQPYSTPKIIQMVLTQIGEHELAHLPLASKPPAEGVALGLCSGSDARTLFFDTVESVIVPGLERHGIPAKRAWSCVVDRRDTRRLH